MSEIECSPQLARMLANRRTLAEVEAQRRTRLLADAEALRGRAMMEQCKPHSDEWTAFELRRGDSAGTALFGGQVADSDRIDQHVWAWPLTDIERFEPVVPARGAQGFWNWEAAT